MNQTREATINLNDVVRVQLTVSGKKIADSAPYVSYDADGNAVMMVWQLMALFGPHLYVGMSDPPFVGNQLLVQRGLAA